MVQTATLMKYFLTIAIVALGLLVSRAQESVPTVDSPPDPETPVEATAEGTPPEVTPAEGEAVIPTAFDISRYQSTWDKNPFLLKTVAATQPTVNWAQDYSLAGMFNNKGKIRISIRNKQTNDFKYISSDAKPDAEFRLVKANFNRNRNEASAVIAKGAEEAEIKYDEATAPQAVTINNTMRPNGAGAPGQPAGGGAPGGVGGINRPGQPQLNKPGVPMPNGRVFNAPGLPGGVSAQPGNPQYATGGGFAGNAGNVNVAQPGNVQSGVVPTAPNNPGATAPVISRRRQLIPAPVIPAQP